MDLVGSLILFGMKRIFAMNGREMFDEGVFALSYEFALGAGERGIYAAIAGYMSSQTGLGFVRFLALFALER